MTAMDSFMSALMRGIDPAVRSSITRRYGFFGAAPASRENAINASELLH